MSNDAPEKKEMDDATHTVNGPQKLIIAAAVVCFVATMVFIVGKRSENATTTSGDQTTASGAAPVAAPNTATPALDTSPASESVAVKEPPSQEQGTDKAPTLDINPNECGGQNQSIPQGPPNYSGFKMTSGSFKNTDMSEAKFVKSNLIGVSFKNARLTKTDFTEVWLRGVDFTGTNLEDAILTGALYDEKTIFPEGFDPKAHGMRTFAEAPEATDVE